MNRHGDRNDYFIVGQEIVDPAESTSESSTALATNQTHCMAAASHPAIAADDEPKYKFGWISAKTAQTYKSPEIMVEKLLRLSACLNDPTTCHNQPADAEPAESTIPSGYTYFGQFLAHEITFDREPSLAPDNYRSPEIDLDSLYGAGPTHESRLYQDHARLKIDFTFPIPNLNREFPNDLPREQSNDPKSRGRALIGDPRNDENVVVAQMHVAFVRFHNKVVDALKSIYSEKDLFERSREEVVKHFQWIILYDYLPRIAGADVVTRVLKEGLEGYICSSGNELFIPLEFSAAAFRFGHSMIRKTYSWNRYHRAAGLGDLFRQTRFSGQMVKLTSDWVIDWRHFYDFEGFGYPTADINMARRIDTVFDLHLETIADYPHKAPDLAHRSITFRNLLRGFELGMPTGEEMATHLKVPVLSAESIRGGRQKHLLNDPDFEGRTPLWYYILREAEIETEKKKVSHLGPVGGLIVAGTLVEIIRHSRHSIIRDSDWRPRFGRPGEGDGPSRFEMTDLLHFADVVAPIAKHQNYV